MKTMMLKFCLQTVFIFFIVDCFGQPCECTSKEAKNHNNEFCVISGYITEAKCISNDFGKEVFLDVGGNFPDNDLSVVIREKYFRNFSKAPDLLYKGKNVLIYG